jgi:hypothetical protein
LFIPYQDSKLTMILSNALGGNSKTTVIVTGALEGKHAVETIQTLRFGEMCAAVKQTASSTGIAVARVLREIEGEIERVEALIKRDEHWETRLVARDDVVDGEVVGVEHVPVSTLVGAGHHRVELEALLAKKRALLGEPDSPSPAKKKAFTPEQRQEQDGSESGMAMPPMSLAGRLDAAGPSRTEVATTVTI